MRNSRLHKSNRQFLWSTMALAIMVLAMVFIMLYLASCTNDTHSIATGECGDSVTMAYYSVDYFNSIDVDSVEVKDGKFVMECDADTVGFRIVQTVDGNTWTYFIEPGNITLHQGGTVSGTPLNDDYQQFISKVENADVLDEEALMELFKTFVSSHKDDLAGVMGVVNATRDLNVPACKPLLDMLPPERQAVVFTSVPKKKFMQ